MFRRLLSTKPVLVLPWKNFSITNVMTINKAVDKAKTKVVIKAPSRNFWDRKDWLTKQIWTIFFVFGCGSTAIVTCKCSPHTILIQVTRDTFQQKIEKKPVELSDKLKGVVTNALKEMNWSYDEAGGCNAIMSNYYYESPRSYGEKGRDVLLILPSYYNADSGEDVASHLKIFVDKKDDIEGIKTAIEKNYSPKVQKLKDSIILSEEAMKFSIARELLRSEWKLHKTQTYLALGSMTSNYLIIKTINKLWRPMSHAPFKARVLNAGFWTVCHVMFYYIAKSTHAVNFEKNLDDATARISPSMARGGIEFFEQEKKRHLALRALYPNKGGEKLYNLKGDAIPTNIFLKGIKADERIEICTNVYNLHQAGLT